MPPFVPGLLTPIALRWQSGKLNENSLAIGAETAVFDVDMTMVVDTAIDPEII